jgi:hypothetical protein
VIVDMVSIFDRPDSGDQKQPEDQAERPCQHHDSGDDCDGSEEDRPSCPGNPESLMAIVDVATRNGHASTPAVIARRRQIA